MNTKKVIALKAAKSTLEAAVQEYREAAHQLDHIKARLAEAKVALVPLLGKLPSEGTRRITVADATVVVRTRLTRRLNKAKVDSALETLPAHITDRVLPVTRKLSLRELRFLEDNDHDSYRCIRSTFTVTKAAPSIEVE